MRSTGAECYGGGDWSAVWQAFKGAGRTMDRGTHRCPACSEAWREKLDKEARHGPAER